VAKPTTKPISHRFSRDAGAFEMHVPHRPFQPLRRPTAYKGPEPCVGDVSQLCLDGSVGIVRQIRRIAFTDTLLQFLKCASDRFTALLGGFDG
jgi:hypothetical protein